MPAREVTSWTIIREASTGKEASRGEFARRYEALIRVYLARRWRRTALLEQVDDAVQDVFVECFRSGGVLEKVDPDRPGGFRGFLYGVVRNVALRVESKKFRRREQPADSRLAAAVDDDPSLSRVFDQEWVSMILRESARLQDERASRSGSAAERRVELLRLRFEADLPIRKIAERWGEEPALLHRQYRIAREEFRRALRQVLVRHQGGSVGEIDAEGERLLALFD